MQFDELPVITTWQEDGGPFITLPLVYTEHPATKKHNLGIYRMQVYDARRPDCTGRFKKAAGFIITRPNSWASRCRSRFFSADRRL